MKKSTGKLLIGLAVGVLLAGGIGAIAYGSDGFTNSDISTWFDGEWRAINFEDQTKEYTGSKIEPDIVLPDGFTYEITKIEKDGEEVDLETGAVASGDYVFTIAITKTSDGETRNYFVNLKIDADGELPTEIKANNLKFRTLKVEALSSGEIVKEMSYSVEPGDADQTIELVSILKDGSDAASFVTCSIDTLQKKITLTCKQAFDSKITITVRHKTATGVQGTITCDYKKKALSSSITINDQLDGSHIATIDDGTIWLDPHSVYSRGLSDEVDIANGTSSNVTYSIGTLEPDKVSESWSWKVDYSKPLNTNQMFDEQEFFNDYVKINKTGGIISFGGTTTDWSTITNVTYANANHRIKLGAFTFVDEGNFSHVISVWLQASSSAVNSITLDSSVVF